MQQYKGEERLNEIISFTPFFSFLTKTGITILDDYLFMNPEFFSKEEFNSEIGLYAEDIWNVINKRRVEFNNKGINFEFLYKSSLKKINFKAYLLDKLKIKNEDLLNLFNKFFSGEVNLEAIKLKHDIDLKEIFTLYIKEK